MQATTQKISSILKKAGISKKTYSSWQGIIGAYGSTWDYSLHNEFDYKYNYNLKHTHRNYKKKVFTGNIVVTLENKKSEIKKLLSDFTNIVYLNN